ncbi:hypothetical protein [Novosphingobium sp. BL-52-GroH]|uniref:hypothetical protein n=1 Tax=Novosphingobium sp. BL-52-GroH TaxID=3349877 RepID=UPI00384C926F
MLHAEGMTFGAGHSDLSFRDPTGWTRVSAGDGSPPSLWISLGDPQAGPAVQLGICPPVPQAMWLDTHYHATDQLRAVVQGGFQLQRKRMGPGDFGYQASGIPYREGLVDGGDAPLWMFAVHGDRRGARSTTTRHDGSFELGEVAEDQLDRPVASPDDPYWRDVPGGARGVSALAISEGRAVGGFHWGCFDDAQDWHELAPGVRVCAAVLGDALAGPVVLMIRAAPGATILPEHVAGSEVVLVPFAGSLHSGFSRIAPGDVRIVPASARMTAIVAGEAGVDLIYMIADRRAVSTMFAPADGTTGSGESATETIRSIVAALASRVRE